MADIDPIIIKRFKKPPAAAHHGGAWKVAYADFVTAMMAFFLLLWLINVTSPEQKMGLAEYFTPTTGLKDAMGIGFKGGKKPSPDVGRSNTDMVAPGLIAGQVKQGPVSGQPTDTPRKVDPDAESTSVDEHAKNDSQDNGGESADSETFKAAAQDVKQAVEADQNLQDYKNNIVTEDTPEGLKIEMIDDEKKPMYDPGGAVLTDIGKKVLDSMANIIIKTPNNIAIQGHTDASISAPNPQYTNWELSADRANAARRFLVTTQLETDRVMKVIGMASRELLTPQEPTSPRNRRITILLMRGSYFRDPKEMATTRTLLSVPDANVKQPVKIETKPAEDTNKSSAPSMFDPSQMR